MVPDFVLHSLITTTPLFTVNGSILFAGKMFPMCYGGTNRDPERMPICWNWIQFAGEETRRDQRVE